MNAVSYINQWGDFVLRDAQRAPGAYMPLVNEGGMMSSVTPLFSGDSKTSQNTFLLPPAGESTLRDPVRNFWVLTDGAQPWSAVGQSAAQLAGEETCTLQGGLLWQSVKRCRADGLEAQVLSFVPAGTSRAEIMQVKLTNHSTETMRIAGAAAMNFYGRSADNIRDHRHVTSLLHRAEMREYGLDVKPTMTFDERGHKPGTVTYRVWAAQDEGVAPAYSVPLAENFQGGGSLLWPDAVTRPDETGGRVVCGESAMGGELTASLFFAPRELASGESTSFQIVMTIDDDPSPWLTPSAVENALHETRDFWQKKAGGLMLCGDGEFTSWMRWVAIQPVLRRIYGCSFLPHHDYGRGGRGWRDLWQDSLALILSEPDTIRESLLCHFAGVRTDGTNATIIGSRPGEFKADRNNIPRVWMDHGFWPLVTTELYLNETGDFDFLLEDQTYFSDELAFRGEWPREGCVQAGHRGTVLEHLLVQNVTAFFDAGEHGHIRLRGADWNDGLDMAARRGESVAFTAAYAGNFETLADLTERMDDAVLSLSAPLVDLLRTPREAYEDPALRVEALKAYCRRACAETEKAELPAQEASELLKGIACWLRSHIRKCEWVGDGTNQHWFNSYYDDNGRQVEGVFDGAVRMMLTGQVFALMSSTATDEQAQEMIRAADWYLFDPNRGGYFLNTDFHEVKMDMGRMFGFAYGTKENGAVFCHMAVMYAYALYLRGFAREGWKALSQLYVQSTDFRHSRLLPGVPEYFDLSGRGMYPYLTGAGSWFMLTMQTRVFGVRGEAGDLLLNPMLTGEQFDERGVASIECRFAGKPLRVVVENPKKLDWGEYVIESVQLGAKRFPCGDDRFRIPRAELEGESELQVHLILSEK